jgi:diadenosine tetraphosphate (Ap4A) HIT family hydrolase
MVSKEQIDQIKKQLLDQIEKTFPPTQKEVAKKQILEMNEEQLMEFLKKNKMIKEPVEGTPSPKTSPEIPQEQQCIFCSIIEGKIPTYKIDENKDSIATLEINPISKSHVLIIPKKHLESSEKLPSTAFSLAKKIAKKIKTKFKPLDVQIHSSNVFGHEILNVLPIYKDESMTSQRSQGNKEELEKLKKKLEKKSKKKTTKPKVQKLKEKMLIPRRIP